MANTKKSAETTAKKSQRKPTKSVKNATRQPLRDSAAATNTTPGEHANAAAEISETQKLREENAQLKKLCEENAQLKNVNQENEKLRKELAARANRGEKRARATTTEARVPRPAGPVSKWSLQKEMGLEGSVEKRKMYEAIQRTVRTAIDSSGIDWTLAWSQIPPSDKVNMFATVRSKVDGMDRYVQDWATEGLARQLMKNRRTYAYRKGHLEVPDKFGHLKANAAKRSNAPRGKRKATSQAVKATPTKRAKVTKRKGKAEAIDNGNEQDDGNEQDNGDEQGDVDEQGDKDEDEDEEDEEGDGWD